MLPPSLRTVWPRRPALGLPGARGPVVWQRLAWALSMAAALTLVALGAQAGKNGACAQGRGDTSGRARVATGQANMVAEGARWRGGDCSLGGALLGDLVAAVSAEQYAGSAACGAYLDVTGPSGTVRVQVVDECASCAPGELDLSRSAFARVAGTDLGIALVSYHTVHNPEVPRPVAFRLKQGSSARWLAIQAIDHGNPLQRLEVLREGRWQALSRDFDNYWVADRGLGSGPYTVRITDVYGQQVTATGIRLVPRGLQRTTRRLYGPAKASPVPRDHSGNGAHGAAGGAAPRAGVGSHDGRSGSAPPGDGGSGKAASGTSGVPGPVGPRQSAAGPGSQGHGAGGLGSQSDGVPESWESGSLGDGSAGSIEAGAGAGVSGSEGHAARGTLQTPSDGTLSPDPDRAPFTALPSSRPFFC
ncbi:expansin EXLX1 family cellulose-binding protein [Sphaerisporangium sp. NPDC088356]|uniref:expansin EXLX1 family cellulose-binding protein n=1 Tax=Sphaerisporangium sp. NPDC088356 TaxID=3154871 RepID=UPI00343A6748